MDTQFFETAPVQKYLNNLRGGGKTHMLSTGEVQAVNRSIEIDETMPFEGQKQILLVIQDTPVRLLLLQNSAVTLGRMDTRANIYPDLDLTPYGGSETGVSRTHATLVYKNRALYVTDLGSSNGTYLNGERLQAHKPEPVLIGEVLVLGRLTVQIESPKLHR
ncbi:MAG: FHA domain-containing protein [Anaerolineae bacterium]